jgi:hypothetical protein
VSCDDELYERLPDLLGMRSVGPDEADLLEAIDRSPRLGERLAALRRVHALLRAGDRAERPGPALEARILSIPGLTPRSTRPSPGRRGWAAIVAVAAAACVVALLVVSSVRDASASFAPIGQPVALVDGSGGRSGITVQLGEVGGDMRVQLVASGLRSDGRSYALWLEGPSGAVKVEDFAPDKNGDCSLMLPAVRGDWRAALITHSGETPAVGTIARASL